MIIYLRDCYNKKHSVVIPDDTEYISGVVLSGDMVMKHPFNFDPSDNRRVNINEGHFYFRKEQFSLLKEDSFDIYNYVKPHNLYEEFLKLQNVINRNICH